MPQNKSSADDNQDLLDRFRNTTGEDVSRGVKRVEHYTTDDEAGHNRYLRSQGKRTKTKLFNWFLHFLFVIVCGVVLVLSIGLLWLTFLWVSSFTDDPKKIQDLLSKAFEYGVVVVVTLFVSGIVPKD